MWQGGIELHLPWPMCRSAAREGGPERYAWVHPGEVLPADQSLIRQLRWSRAKECYEGLTSYLSPASILAPNVSKLSGECSGAERVRRSAGLGGSASLKDEFHFGVPLNELEKQIKHG